MLPAKSLAIGMGVLAWLAIGAFPASAEWFADLYLGAAFTDDQDVSVSTQFVLGMPVATPVAEKFKDVDFDTSVSFGGRGGYWFEQVIT